MPSPIPTTTTSLGKNIDCMIKMRVSSTMASKKPSPKKKTTSKTKPSTIAMPSPKKTAVDSLTEITINRSESNKDTASLTLDPTKPTDVSNVNVPQKKKQKKNDITSTLGTRRNTKHKLFLDENSDDHNVPNPTKPTDVSNVKVLQKKKQKKNDITSSLGPSHNTNRKNNLHEDSDDCNVPHPPAGETNVPTYACNWAQAIICKYPQLPPMKCQHTDCELLVHHICQAAWEQREGH